jgi:hypothetical protein
MKMELEAKRKREEFLVKSVKHIGKIIGDLARDIHAGLYIGSKNLLQSQLFLLYAYAREISDILEEYKYWEAEQAIGVARKIIEQADQLSKNIDSRDRFTEEDERIIYSISRNYDLLLSLLEKIPFHHVSAKDFYSE